PPAGPSASPQSAGSSTESNSGGGGSIWDTVSGLTSSVGSAISSGASAVYQNYEKSTDFKALGGALDKGVDWVEKESAAGNQNMVDSAKGIPVLEQLAQASAWVGNA